MVESDRGQCVSGLQQIELQSRELVSPLDLVLFKPFGLDFFPRIHVQSGSASLLAAQVLFVFFGLDPSARGSG